MNKHGWIGVDLDGTLAKYDGWKGPEHIGEPIPKMVEHVKKWMAEGFEIRIFTARASVPEQIPPIKKWLKEHNLPEFKITNVKDFAMVSIVDDRAIQVIPNTGELLEDKLKEK